MSSVVFLIEGLSSLVNSQKFGGNTACKYLTSMSVEEYAQTRGSLRVIAVAQYNNFFHFDPLVGYNTPEVIYNVAINYGKTKNSKALGFELAVIRALKEIVFQADSEYRELMRKQDYFGIIKKCAKDDTPIIQLTKSALPQIAKAYFQLKEGNHLPGGYVPEFISNPATFSTAKAFRNIAVKYKKLIPQTGDWDFYVNVDQHIATAVTPKLNSAANEIARKNLEKVIDEHPEITDVYAVLGVNHVKFISEDLNPEEQGSKLKYNAIAKTLTINNVTDIDFHIFPDRHGVLDTYNSLQVYAKKKHIKIPTIVEAKALSVSAACNFTEDKEAYFTDQELSTMICESVDQYSSYTNEQCQQILKLIALSPSNSEVCTVNDGYDKWFWYSDLLLRGVCNSEESWEL